MNGAGFVLMVVGTVIGIAGVGRLLMHAFRENIWWGLGAVFVPVFGLVFVIHRWHVCKRPFLVFVAGCTVNALGILCGGIGF